MHSTAIVIAIVAVVLVIAILAILRGVSPARLRGPAGGAHVPPPPQRAYPKSDQASERTQVPSAAAQAVPGAAKKPAAELASPERQRAPIGLGGEPTLAGDAPRVATDGLKLRAADQAPMLRGPRDVAGLRKGLAATRGGFIAKLTALFQGQKEIDPATLEQLEELMLASDVGPKTTQAILGRLRDALGRRELRDTSAVWAALRAEASRILTIGDGAIQLSAKPTVVLVVGVNGVGKTTTIGKLATRFHGANRKVMLAAGDTFRAAAVQQLEIWGKRVGAEVVRGKDGADPSAVAFDATNRAKAQGADLLLVDTAGRLHTKVPLMDEIKKVRKTIAKAMDGAPHEVLLVLDATTGQNALAQASLFRDALDLTGIVLTKLDGTAKGGIVLAICDELRLPVRYVGLGERAEDLREFYADEFVEALFGRGEEEIAAA